MPHDTPLITTIVAALVLAFIFGAIANRLKMPPLVGYLIAGVCVGPHSPGFVADQTLAPQLAEIGVILLMFGVGLEFSLRDLLSVRAIAVPGAILQIAAATGLGWGLATLMGWSLGGGLVFGLALSVSSTVVLLKALQERHLVDSDRGRIAVGWLIVEDLAMVLALVLIPSLAGVMGGTATADAIHAAASDPFVALTEQLLHMHLPLWGVLTVTVVKLLAFVGFMLVVGRRVIPFILHATAHTGSRELFRLAVLAIALGVAAGAAYLFGVSLALGAFFAGMILSESELSHRAAQETLPLRDAFGVLFFVSVGMLFDPSIILRDPLPVLATLVIVLFGKSLIGFVLLVLFRRPVASALTISAALAQIGEFSFILAALGISLGLMPEEGRGLILAGAIFSIILNPLAFYVAERLRPRLEARSPRRSEPELGPVVPDRADQVEAVAPSNIEVLEEVAQPTRLSNHVVLIGYGRVGGVVAGELSEEGAPFVLVEDAEGRVLAARAAGIEVIVGNAATRGALMLANVMGARCVVIAIPNAFEAGQAVEQCRKLNAAVRIIARAHSDEEVEYLRKLGADEVIMGEREIGLGMIDWLKGQPKGEGRRDAAPAVAPAAAPPLAGRDNLLQQARSAQPRGRSGVGAVGLPLELDLSPLAPPEEEPAVLAEPEVAVIPVEPILPPATGLARPIAVPGEALSTMRTERPEETATAASSLAAIAGRPAGPMPAARNVVVPFAPPATEVARLNAEPASPPATESAVVPEPAPAEVLLPPVIQLGPSEPAPAVIASPEPPAMEIAPPATGSIEMGVETPPSSPAVSAAPPVVVVAPTAREPEPADNDAAALGAVEGASRPSPGFRIVRPADIDILPPEPPRWSEDEVGAEAEATAFRSEFWDEPTAGGADEPELFPGGTRPTPPLRDVRETEAARAAVEDGSWFEALEHDLFGEDASPGDTPPPEVPGPVPQPVETPQPQEDPVPPQPSEPTPPAEVPGPAPTPPPADPRAADDQSIDAFGRREPRF